MPFEKLIPPAKFVPQEPTIVVTSNVPGEANSIIFLQTGQKVLNPVSPLVDAIKLAQPGDVIALRGTLDKTVNIGFPKNPASPDSSAGGGSHYAFWRDAQGQFVPVRDVSIVSYDPQEPAQLAGINLLGNIEIPNGGGIENLNVIGPMTVMAKTGASSAISSPHGSQLGLFRLYDVTIRHESPGSFYGGYDLKWGSRMNGTGSYDWRNLDFPPTQEHAVYNDNCGWDHSETNPRFNCFINIESPRSGRTGIQLVNRRIDDPTLGPNNPAGSPRSAKGPLLIEGCRFNLDHKDNAFAITVVGHLGHVEVRRNFIRTKAGGINFNSDPGKGMHLDENGFTTSSLRLTSNRIISFAPALGGKAPIALSGVGHVEFHNGFLIVNETAQRPSIDVDNEFGGPINTGPVEFYNLNLPEGTTLSDYQGWADTDFCKLRIKLQCLSKQALDALYFEG